MDLQYVYSATHIEVYLDKANNWLFVDWLGDLTLEKVQHACLAIASYFLERYYPRVLNSNAQVTSISPEAAAWIASDFLPVLNLTGIAQLAWVIPDGLRTRTNVLSTVNLFPHIAVNLFDTVPEAVGWLQQTTSFVARSELLLLGRLYTDDLKLRRLVHAYTKRLSSTATTIGLA